ncbi:arginine N-succinyltransferase [Vibrio diazotrophicus]|uniref:arginine N-succinyltransferase n=1 Tax=Vibrio diazotrophicus TaxID=685 RepID=UPI0005A9A581|nr:arginine N-succinyltransferase [Vibrio diazotrophicus]MCZ4373377.1 arginine N-succinyltransferase [Vibrio diazotrophicus]PNH93522.1 arginine N-succinyltransferase [Vibrio diazotrophicus]
MIVLRPVKLTDLSNIEKLAVDSGPMVCTLPAKREHLLQKIEQSIYSFEQDVFCPGEESYFFVLEETDTGHLLGTGAINALAGYRQAFYSFRNDIIIHSSRELNVHSRIHALTLNHDLSDHSQLCSFYIDPSQRHTLSPALITLGRLMFMNANSNRFANEWMAVLPGIADTQGRAPFWEHVGRKFFGMDYNQVEYYNGTRDKAFVAELMPHYPLYVPLINEEAQAVMGQVHQDAELQYQLLNDQGFEPDKYVEIFDAGPILTAPHNALPICLNMKTGSLVGEPLHADTKQYLVGYQGAKGFCAFIAEGNQTEDRLIITKELMEEVGLTQHQKVWFLAL